MSSHRFVYWVLLIVVIAIELWSSRPNRFGRELLLILMHLTVPLVILAIARSGAIQEGTCKCCGYNLTGNRSGICPECGAVVGSIDRPESGGAVIIFTEVLLAGALASTWVGLIGGRWESAGYPLIASVILMLQTVLLAGAALVLMTKKGRRTRWVWSVAGAMTWSTSFMVWFAA